MITFGSLFAGIGGIDLGLERAGMTCAWQVEIDDYATRVLQKHWPDVPKFRDVRECGAHNLPAVDLIAGGFPCQDISNAGRQAGIDGERSGLWREYARIICELRPRYVLVENVAALLIRGMGDVLGTLASLGYDTEWQCISASSVGAVHRRERIFIVAYTHGNRLEAHADDALLRLQANNDRVFRHNGASIGAQIFRQQPDRTALQCEPARLGGTYGLSDRLGQIGRIKGCGNAVVPQIAEFIGQCIVDHASKL